MPAQTRRQRESEFAKSLIIESAVQIFARKGFHGATMDEIARNAGYSPAALYKYFPNKQGVFEVVLQALGDQFVAVFDDIGLSNLKFEERLKWVLRRLAVIADKNKDFFAAFLSQRCCFDWDSGSDLASAATDNHTRYLAQVEKLMCDGIALGALDESNDPLDCTLAFVGISNAYSYKWLRSSESLPLDDHIDIIVSLFLNGAKPRSSNTNRSEE